MRRHSWAIVTLATLLLLAGCVAASPSDPTQPATSGPNATSQPSAGAPEPGTGSSQDLIAADLASGAIDQGTALRLRAWALFGDPRLPEPYDGSGSHGEDQALFEEIAASLDSLPAEQREQLERYLLRPTDPRSPFSSAPAVATGGGVVLAGLRTATEAEEGTPTCLPPRQWFSQEWGPGGATDRGFTVWACGPSRATVQSDLDSVIAVGSRLWDPMTKAPSEGMGLPVPDTLAAQSDGSGKVDVYLLEPLAPCRQRGTECRPIPGSGVAAAVLDRPLNCGVDGFPSSGCSGYLLLGRGRLGSTALAADFAHEFFHVLQFAHNGRMDPTWYTEASAVWAEWHYEREAARAGAYRHFEEFQAENRSLLWYEYNAQYQYRAWGWPLFQSTQDGAASVFQAWQGIEGASSRADVDRAVNDQLPFETAFRDFAVRNAQPAAYIPPASTGLDGERWQSTPNLSDFPPDPHRVTSARSPVTLGEGNHAADIDPLTAQYDEYEVLDEEVRQIKIDISELTGAAQADLDVLGQVGDGDGWRRFKSGHTLTLCRDDASEDVSFFQVIISNHEVARNGNLPDLTKRVHGTYTIEAKEECDPQERYIGGTITWDAVEATSLGTKSVSGRLELVLRDAGGGMWLSERGDGSTYTYDVNIGHCTPDGHLSGVVESGVGFYEPDWKIASAIVLETDATPADLGMSIYLYDEWDVICDLPNSEPYPFTASAAGLFPGCERFAYVIAENDGEGSFTIDCQVANPQLPGWSGRITGELHPIEGPSPPED